ncbi:hypothetical protein SCHPADRAFT_655354 [Schizopora paradoxa]|uniref:Uncharacterized protein n=1 Tax=Schizopora paradoxa TaxID=27342 RepID=A0A0H2RCS1_9AGAM|nr:hypothetical protein SCHPADRAFT_655354 [Schizopora paradoxa]
MPLFVVVIYDGQNVSFTTFQPVIQLEDTLRAELDLVFRFGRTRLLHVGYEEDYGYMTTWTLLRYRDIINLAFLNPARHLRTAAYVQEHSSTPRAPDLHFHSPLVDRYRKFLPLEDTPSLLSGELTSLKSTSSGKPKAQQRAHTCIRNSRYSTLDT